MLVVYQGTDKCLLTEHNGKRYCFQRDIPKEISQVVYDYAINSRHVEMQNLHVVERKPVHEKPVLEKTEGVLASTKFTGLKPKPKAKGGFKRKGKKK